MQPSELLASVMQLRTWEQGGEALYRTMAAPEKLERYKNLYPEKYRDTMKRLTRLAFRMETWPDWNYGSDLTEECDHIVVTLKQHDNPNYPFS